MVLLQKFIKSNGKWLIWSNLTWQSGSRTFYSSESEERSDFLFRSPRAKPTTFYEGLGTMAPTVGDRPPLSLNWASLALSRDSQCPLRGVLPRASSTVPLCPGNARTLSGAFRCFSPIMNPLLVPRDDWLLFWGHLLNWWEAELKILPLPPGFKNCSQLLAGESCLKP